jgi:hypothetical protein
MDTKKLRIGEVIGVALRMWRKNFQSFVVLTALVHSPWIIVGAVVSHGDIGWGTPGYERVMTYARFSVAVPVLLDLVVAALLAPKVVRELEGERVPFARIDTARTGVLPALATAIVAYLCIAGAYLCGALLFDLGRDLDPIVGVCLALPVFSVVYVAPQAAMSDRSGVLAALRRSWVLTRRHRFQIIVLQVLLLALWVVLLLLGAALGGSLETLTYFDAVRWILLGSLGSTVACVMYYYLRTEHAALST